MAASCVAGGVLCGPCVPGFVSVCPCVAAGGLASSAQHIWERVSLSSLRSPCVVWMCVCVSAFSCGVGYVCSVARVFLALCSCVLVLLSGIGELGIVLTRQSVGLFPYFVCGIGRGSRRSCLVVVAGYVAGGECVVSLFVCCLSSRCTVPCVCPGSQP